MSHLCNKVTRILFLFVDRKFIRKRGLKSQNIIGTSMYMDIMYINKYIIYAMKEFSINRNELVR